MEQQFLLIHIQIFPRSEQPEFIFRKHYSIDIAFYCSLYWSQGNTSRTLISGTDNICEQ